MKLHKLLFAVTAPFLALSANIATIDVPGPLGVNGTAPQAINSFGVVAGFSNDAAGVSHGFIRKEGKFTAFDYPGFLQTSIRGINNRGELVGQIDNGPVTSQTKPTSGFIRDI